MAPFNTHFLVAEQIWAEFISPQEYGAFCFGCVLPDMDKISATLSQKDTHFFDRSTAYELMVTHRSITFLQQQETFFTRPFPDLSPTAQALALGYLCHLSVDEVTKHLWRFENYRHVNDVSVTALFAALDEWARQHLRHHAHIVQAIQTSLPLPPVIPSIPAEEWAYYEQAILAFILAPDTEAEYVALLDYLGRPDAAKRVQRLAQFAAEIDRARAYVPEFQLPRLVELSVKHSRRRLTQLTIGQRPAPMYPDEGL